MKIVTIIGARPQFIKASTISRVISTYDNIKEIIIHTGQHYDENMSDIFFEQMNIPKPDFNLGVNSLSHGAMTGQMLEKIENVLVKEQPDFVIVYGDTNSTFAGALAAKKLGIKVAHIEAGLRSFNLSMPEEVNRILTDRISDILFCPTETAVNNLTKEGYNNIQCKIVKSGDVMYDAAKHYSRLEEKPKLEISSNFVLATIHRAENTNDTSRLKNILDSLIEISKEVEVILPIHPRTSSIIKKTNLETGSIKIIEPVGYLQMIYLLKRAKIVLTDSGGLQKESFFFKKPCLTMRDETEWIELVENKFNTLVGANTYNILEAYRKQDYKLDFSLDLYGDGSASKTIIEELINFNN